MLIGASIQRSVECQNTHFICQLAAQLQGARGLARDSTVVLRFFVVALYLQSGSGSIEPLIFPFFSLHPFIGPALTDRGYIRGLQVFGCSYRFHLSVRRKSGDNSRDRYIKGSWR